MAFFDCAGIKLYLDIPSSPDYVANSFVYYPVNDIDKRYQQLKDKGVTFLHAPHCLHKTAKSALWMAGFKDSEGSFAQLMEEK